MREMSTKAATALLKKAFSDKNAHLTHSQALDILAKLKGYEAWSHMQQAVGKAEVIAGRKAEKQAASVPRPGIVQRTLASVLSDHYGSWNSYPALPREDWAYEVGNHDTGLGYWDWVCSELQARDLYDGPTTFTAPAPTGVTLPDGAVSSWKMELNLTDRWGDHNSYDWDGKPGSTLLQLDEALDMPEKLCARLREQMWGEDTFIVRKDDVFGLLFELEYTSQESETEMQENNPEAPAEFKPHAKVFPALLAGLSLLRERFPSVEMCVPDAVAIYQERPAVWAFVPLDGLDEQQRNELGLALSTL